METEEDLGVARKVLEKHDKLLQESIEESKRSNSLNAGYSKHFELKDVLDYAQGILKYFATEKSIFMSCWRLMDASEDFFIPHGREVCMALEYLVETKKLVELKLNNPDHRLGYRLNHLYGEDKFYTTLENWGAML